jgi:integrase
MASLNRLPKGRWQIQVMVPVDGGKVRRSIRPGKMSKRTAEGIKAHVEHLVAAKASGQPLNPATADWLAEIDADLYGRLARVGLIEAREAVTVEEEPTLATFTNAYINSRQGAKPNTIRNMRRARQQLINHFGTDILLREVTEGDADDWYQHLVGKGYALATIGRDVKRARQFFIAAMQRGLVDRNPFSKLKAHGANNRERDFFVTCETAQLIIEACPDAQWRLIVALSRYGGIRCPSELLALTWADINWERSRMHVRSSKTECHDGKGSRWVPIFPELRPYLDDCRELAQPGDEYVISRYRENDANLRTQLLRIIERAGVAAWKKPFQNMRATRETELCQTFPLHVVCQWIGNSTTIAAKHYLQVTEEHFTKASGGDLPSVDCTNVVQKAVQSMQVKKSHDKTASTQPQASEQLRNNMPDSDVYCTFEPVPPRGIEPLFSD